ncbi:MAG: chemotaxis protein CheW [Gammaproteobacteria bacterium]|nr:chemotaxis protein CheW [Gammaproteobacteria bacterium]
MASDISAVLNTDDTANDVVDPIAALEQQFVLPSESASSVAKDRREARAVTRQSFRVGDLHLLVPQDATREVLRLPGCSRIPNTPNWFKGLANVRGGLVPVIDMALALGLDNQIDEVPYLLVFGHGDEAIGMMINGLPRSMVLEPGSRRNDSPPVPDVVKEHITGVYEKADQLWFDLDHDGFLDSLTESMN